MIAFKRIYEPYSQDDGFRILVDRLWPRGDSKEKAKIDLWFKDIAPSTELRKWFGHQEEKWPEFEKRYRKELAQKKGLIEELKKLSKRHKKVTLLYGAKDERHNEAVIIAKILSAQKQV
jgi:uncharacterized protein YeaO (DUF488 family)